MQYGTCTKVAFAVAAALLASCQGPKRDQGMISRLDDPQLTERQLRLAMHDHVLVAAGIIEAASMRIAFEAQDPSVDHAATTWRSNYVSGIHTAAFNADPAMGMADVLAFEMQVVRYCQSDQAREFFGAWQPATLTAAERVHADTLDILKILIENEEERTRVLENLKTYCDNNPIEDLSFARVSIVSYMSTLLEEELLGVTGAAASLEQRSEDMASRMRVYAKLLPKDARWQAELVMLEMLEYADDSVSRLMDQAQVILTQERNAVMTSLTAEREALVQAADVQRREILAALTVEREALINAFDKQTTFVLAAVQEQRRDSLQWLDEEREQTAHDVERISSVIIEKATSEAGAAGERLLLRAFLYGVLAVGLLLLAAVLLLRLGGGALRVEIVRRD